jgi:hypothetical protein
MVDFAFVMLGTMMQLSEIVALVAWSCEGMARSRKRVQVARLENGGDLERELERK